MSRRASAPRIDAGGIDFGIDGSPHLEGAGGGDGHSVNNLPPLSPPVPDSPRRNSLTGVPLASPTRHGSFSGPSSPYGAGGPVLIHDGTRVSGLQQQGSFSEREGGGQYASPVLRARQGMSPLEIESSRDSPRLGGNQGNKSSGPGGVGSSGRRGSKSSVSAGEPSGDEGSQPGEGEGEEVPRLPDDKYMVPLSQRLRLSLLMGLGLLAVMLLFGLLTDALKGKTEESGYIDHFHLYCALIVWVTATGFITFRIWLFPSGSTRGLLWEVIVFLGFLAFMQLLFYSRPNATTHSFEIRSTLRENIFAVKEPKMETVIDVPSFWNFIEKSVYPFFFPAGATVPASAIWLLRDQLQVYGGFRLRQIRMTPHSCADYSLREMRRLQGYCVAPQCQIPTVCYGRYEGEDDVDKASFVGPSSGRVYKFNENNYLSQSNTLKEPFSTVSFAARGGLVNYPGSGFTEYFITLNNTASSDVWQRLKQLQADSWVNSATRVVFVEFTVASYVDMKWGYVGQQFEFTPNGNVEVSPPSITTGFLVRDTGLDSDWVFWYYPYLMLSLYFMMDQIIRYIYVGLPVLSQPLTYLELVKFALCVTYVALNLTGEEYRPALMQMIDQPDGTVKVPMDGPFYYQTAYLYTTASNILSIVCFLYWVKFLTYLATIPRLAFLGRIFEKVGGKLLGFFVIFFILVIAFAQAYFLVFSTSIADFITTPVACFAMLRALIGGLDFQPMFDADPLYTIFFFVIFVSIMVFTMLTIVVAIVSEDGYKAVAREIAEQDLASERRGKTGFLQVFLQSVETYKRAHRIDLKRDRQKVAQAAKDQPKNI